jgi:hypothetical protein
VRVPDWVVRVPDRGRPDSASLDCDRQDDNEGVRTMKLKTLVVAAGAAAVGYVLGTKAGRAQFEQLKAKADEFAHDPRVRSGVSSFAGEVKNHADKLPDPVAGAVRAAADAVQSATTDEPQVEPRPTGF